MHMKCCISYPIGYPICIIRTLHIELDIQLDMRWTDWVYPIGLAIGYENCTSRLSYNQHCRLRQCYLSGAEILQLFSVCVSIWLLLFSVCMACGCCCSSHYYNWVTEPCFMCSCRYSAFLNTTSGLKAR